MALQTDVELLKKQYIPEGEHEILTVRRHGIVFMLDFIWKSIVALILTVMLAMGSQFFGGESGALLFAVSFLLLLLIYIYQIIPSLIAWRYNFLIVTSDKIIIITNHSFLHQKMNSIHLDQVTSSNFESQFFGLFRCGILHIHLEEKSGAGHTSIITVPNIPAPDTVASAIENAIALKQQRAEGTETPAEQEEKAEVIKETLKEEAKEAPVSEIRRE